MKKFIYSMIIIMLMSLNTGQAEDFDTSHLPKLLGASNAGTEFFLTFHPPYPVSGGQNFIKIYVSSGVETEVKLEVPGKGYMKIQKTIANDIIEFSLTPGIAQPYIKQANESPLPERVFSGAAIHIRANDPIIVYGVIRYQYTSDGYLAIPISGFGKEYIVASWPDPFGGNQSYKLSSFTSIITPHDNTTARIKFGGETWTETAGGKIPGQTSTFMMNSADVVCIGTISKHGDLTGSKVTGNKPLGLISGNHCAFIPVGVWACDVLIEMDLPTNTWGTEYHVTPIHRYHSSGELKNSIIRIFSKEESTQIYRDGQALGFIPKSGGIQAEGWLEYRAADGDQRPVVISGDKPISVTQYNPGIDDDAAEDTDPFQMVLTPFEQYQKEIVFNTPGIKGGYGFDNNFINIVYEATEHGTIPRDLVFAEVNDGVVEWVRLDTADPDPGTEFAVAVDNKRYFSKTIRLNHDGVYKLKANSPFAAYAYGNSWCDTYGFPTSVGLRDLTIPDTLAPNPEWEMNAFGDVDGSITDMPNEAEYRSNLGLVYMDSKNSYNCRFEYEDFIPGETRKTRWQLEVIDNQKESRASLVFSDRCGNDTTIVIEFFPTLISVHPDEFDFEKTQIGEEKEHTFWVINDSKVVELDLTKLKLKFNNQGFEIINNPIPVVVSPLDSVSFTVKFTSTEEGFFEDSIGAGDCCFFWYKAYVKVNVGEPRIVVGRKDFGDVTVDDSKYGMVTVGNIGITALEIYDYNGPDLKPIFEVSDWSAFNEFGTDPTYDDPWVIQPGVEKTFEVKFTPNSEREFLDSIVFISNTERLEGVEIDSVAELTGTGVDANLLANGYDWLRRRIDRPGTFDVPPYDVDGTDKVIFLENSGSKYVAIKNIIVSEDIEGMAFEFDRAALVNTTIEAGAEMYVPVKFHPSRTGAHTLRFTYDNDAGSETETLLQGIGIVPRIISYSQSFGQTEVNANEYLSKTMKITNFSQAQWEYCDSVTITDLIVTPKDAIATTITADEFGSKGFRFDQNKLRVMFADGSVRTAETTLPITLQPGEYIEIDGQFVAPGVGFFYAGIISVSDAETETYSEWTGADISTAVSDNLADYPNLKIMPSPVKDLLIIQNKGAALTTDRITIIDLSGRTIIDKKINVLQGRFEINTSSLQNGMYILRIHTGGKSISEKFSVAR